MLVSTGDPVCYRFGGGRIEINRMHEIAHLEPVTQQTAARELASSAGNEGRDVP
jgi:hypothetical protein